MKIVSYPQTNKRRKKYYLSPWLTLCINVLYRCIYIYILWIGTALRPEILIVIKTVTKCFSTFNKVRFYLAIFSAVYSIINCPSQYQVFHTLYELQTSRQPNDDAVERLLFEKWVDILFSNFTELWQTTSKTINHVTYQWAIHFIDTIRYYFAKKEARDYKIPYHNRKFPNCSGLLRHPLVGQFFTLSFTK